MIRVNATIEEILNYEKEAGLPDKLLLLINDAFLQFKETIPAMENDISYYKGQLPFDKDAYYYTIDYTDGGNINFERIAKQNINYSKYIIDMETSVFVGKAPMITTDTNTKGEIARLTEYNRQMSYRNWKEHLTEAIRYKSKCGKGYLLVHNKENDEFPRFSELDPLSTFVAYDQYIEPDSLFGCYINQIDKDKYLFYVYTQNYVYVFETTSKDKVLLPPDDIKKIQHFFGRVPINEFKNNIDEQSSIEPIKGIISLICAIQNDIVRGNHEAVKSILHIDGLKVGSKEEQETFFDLYVRKGMIITEGETKVNILNNNINQAEAQNTKKQALQDMWAISRSVDFSSPEFAQSASEPALKLKLKGVIDKAIDGEKAATPTIKRIMKCVLNYVKHESPKLFKKIDFDINRMTIKYFHPLPSSDLAMATIQQNLYNMNAWSPNLLSQFTFMEEDIVSYMDSVVKKPEAQVVKELQGINDTNKERQDEVPEDMNQQDNVENFAEGKAQQL
jgi:SPP1 family phage portal protein